MPSFYGPSQGPLGGKFDTRSALALALLKDGVNTSPVQSPTEGIARALTAGLGGYMANMIGEKQDAREAKYGADMAKVLAGGQAKQWVNPDTNTPQIQQEGTGKMVPTAAAGGMQGMMAALQGTNNPDLAQFGMQLGIADLSNKQAMAMKEKELAAQQAAAETAHQRAIALKGIPGARAPVPGVDVPRTPDVQAQLVEEAAAKAAATRQPPPNYQFSDNGVVAIPGGPADPAVVQQQKVQEADLEREAKAKEEMPGAVASLSDAERRLPVIQKAVQAAINLAQGKTADGKEQMFSTAGGRTQQVMGDVAGTDAYEFARVLDTIKANVGFDNLIRIKQSGGTLGALSDAENRLLAALEGSLDPNLGEKLVPTLQDIQARYAEVVKDRKRAFRTKYPDQLPPGIEEADIEETMRANNMTRQQVLDRLWTR